jgi:hypothetical protein
MKRGSSPDFEAYAGDLFGEMMLADTAAHDAARGARKPLSRFIPGLAICAIAGAAAKLTARPINNPARMIGTP